MKPWRAGPDQSKIQNPKSKIRWIDRAAVALVMAAVFVYMVPIYWIAATSIKPTLQIYSRTPVLFFRPTVEHYRHLVYHTISIGGQERILGWSEYLPRYWNSIVIGGTSTLLAVEIGRAHV